MLKFFADLPRRHKQFVMLLCDMVILPFCLWAALALRLSTWEPLLSLPKGTWLLICTPLVGVPIFARLGLYRIVVRYVDERISGAIFYGVSLTTAVLALIVVMLRSTQTPRSSLIIFWLLALFMVNLSRILARRLLRGAELRSLGAQRKRLAIYGAGKAGAQLAMALNSSPEYHVTAFFDDDKDLHGASLCGVRIHSPSDAQEIVADHDIQELILALPSVRRQRRTEIIGQLEGLGLSLKTLPGIAELVGGRVRIEDLREVGVEDLLGRDPVPPNEELLSSCIRGKAVMVTGAGGSIGSELCHQIILRRPSKLILYEISEYALYRVEQDILKEGSSVCIVSVLGDVKDAIHLRSVMSAHGVQTLYHAAAYKHVPMVEANASTGIDNNALGTLEVARSAIELGVETFVLISTDKAVRPTNVMGASKRLAEMILQALSDDSGKTRFCMVRFGNVLGSSGSVVPLFKEQIQQGGPVTVTHSEITRYFMTIPEAAQLVLQAGAMGQGGDVFVLDMGESIKIYDLARKMIQLSGLTVRDEMNPEGEIAIQITGLRPGEKLYEELLIGERVSQTDHPRIMRAEEDFTPWEVLEGELLKLANFCHDQNDSRACDLLKKIVVDYTPQAVVPLSTSIVLNQEDS